MSHGLELGFTNPRVQRLRRLLGRRSSRSDEGAFVVEGRTMIDEAIAAGWSIEGLYASPDATPIAGVEPVFGLAPGVAERVSDLETSPGLFAVVTLPAVDRARLVDTDFAVVADRIADPGNLGTIVRSAEAAGAGAVVVTPGTVDATGPKVVRASAGALFHVAVVPATLEAVRAAGLRLVGTSSHRGVAHTGADWTGRLAIVVGNESAGLEPDAPIDEWVRIEHRGRAESLNVAMATIVLCFEAARHR